MLYRPGPPVPDLTLSEDDVLSTASVLRVELNKVLEVVRDVALGKDFKLFLKVHTSPAEWPAFVSFSSATNCF